MELLLEEDDLELDDESESESSELPDAVEESFGLWTETDEDGSDSRDELKYDDDEEEDESSSSPSAAKAGSLPS